MTATDGATTFRPQPAEGPLPDMLASLEAEFFVEWQVADLNQGQAPTPAVIRPA